MKIPQLKKKLEVKSCGEDFADCASDPTLCVETTEFSLLAGYIADMSDCNDQMTTPANFSEELYIYFI